MLSDAVVMDNWPSYIRQSENTYTKDVYISIRLYWYHRADTSICIEMTDKQYF